MSVNEEKLRKASVEGARSVVKKLNLDALLVTSIDNVRYLTGRRLYYQLDWTSEGAAVAVLPADGDPVDMAIGIFEPVGGEVLGWSSYPYTAPIIIADRLVETYSKALTFFKAEKGRVGLDGIHFAIYEALRKKLPEATFVPVLEELLNVRAVKNEEEIKLFREVAKVEDIGLEAALKAVKIGNTENQVFAEALKAMTAAGSEGPPFFQLCASGKRTVTDIFSSEKVIRDGELVYFDIGCIVKGYIGDATRTEAAGTPSKELKDLYSALYEAHMNGLKTIKPGIKASEIDKKIRETLKEKGYPDYPHSSGHGIGLRVAELPWITTAEEAGLKDMELKPGMVLCVEPTTIKPGVSGAGLEDMILVTETGYEKLTKTPYSNTLLS